MRQEGLDKLKRLRTMGAPEIAYRLRTTLRSEVDRVRFHLRAFDKPEQNVRRAGGPRIVHFKPYFKEGPARRFYLTATEDGRERLRHLIERFFPEWKRRAIEEADRLCQHRVELLGYGEVKLGPEIDWHRDPITGQSWPLRFWADYDLVRDASVGDPKTVHELNRHQHLARLGKAYFLTGEERYAEEALRQIVRWIEQNPPETGIHWHSCLEISLRVLSWLWTLFFVLPAKSLDETTARRVGGSLFAQLDHVHRYLSIFSSPNTHLLGEATALYLAGVIFAEWEHAAEWKRTGKELLVLEMEKQIAPDGVHKELSSYYHCYALDFYLQVLVLAMHNEHRWPDRCWQQLEGMMNFVMHLTRPDGTIPLLGDDDGGRALALSGTHYRSFRDALCAGAVLYGRPDFRYVSGDFCEETLWLLGEKAWYVHSYMHSSTPRSLQASYPTAGYYIQRSDWGERANHLVFDCGNLGMIRGGHGHADALSVVLSAAGKELLVDPGTGIYNSAPEWRNYFRGSRAHNTAVVDDIEQSEASGTFSWTCEARSQLRRHVLHSEIEFVEGEHSGYSRLPQGIVHRRGVLYCRPECWVIVDRFFGEGTHRFDLFYHFSPEAQASFCGSNGTKPEISFLAQEDGACLQLFLCSTAPLRSQLILGRDDCIQGWTSRRYGERRPSPALQVSMVSSAPVVVLSLLLPFSADADDVGMHQAEQLEVEEGSAVACTLRNKEYQDVWVAGTGETEVTLQDYRMRGELFWLRRYADGRKQLFAIDALHFGHKDRLLLQESAASRDVLIQWRGDDELVARLNEGEESACAEFAAS